METTGHTLTELEFAQCFGTTPGEIPPEATRLIHQSDFRYDELSAQDHQRLIAEIRRKIESGQFSRVGKPRRGIWEKVWTERLLDFIRHGYSLDRLVPNFINSNPIVRLNRQYIKAHDPNFEFHFFDVFRTWLFKTYFSEAESIYEFGCGSGFNLVALANLFPDKPLHGLDWTPSSVQLVDLIAEKHGLNLRGRPFDFYEMDEELQFDGRTGVLTMCALEQIGRDFEGFVEFLLARRPAICVQMEPLVELYDATNPMDEIAIQYHRARGYLDGYLGHLRRLEREGRLRIRTVQRPMFGSLYHEGFSFVVWNPVDAH